MYGITVAADLTGMSVQALRLYERKGLLQPVRTPGGTRRYSDTDITRLRRIAALIDEGINLAGIARILGLEADNTALHNDNTACKPATPRCTPTTPPSSPATTNSAPPAATATSPQAEPEGRRRWAVRPEVQRHRAALKAGSAPIRGVDHRHPRSHQRFTATTRQASPSPLPVTEG